MGALGLPEPLVSAIPRERSMLETSEKRRATERWRCCSFNMVGLVGRAWPCVEETNRVSLLASTAEIVISVPSLTV